MAYRELVNVANGVKGQLEACIAAADRHQEPPEELDQLTEQLFQAVQLCETIISKADNEPEPVEEETPAAPPVPTQEQIDAAIKTLAAAQVVPETAGDLILPPDAK